MPNFEIYCRELGGGGLKATSFCACVRNVYSVHCKVINSRLLGFKFSRFKGSKVSNMCEFQIDYHHYQYYQILLLPYLFSLDVDECSKGYCSANAICTNSPSSFSCTCKSDYEGNGFTCTKKPTGKLVYSCTINHKFPGIRKNYSPMVTDPKKGYCSKEITCTTS